MGKRDLKADLEAIRDGTVLFKDPDPNSGIQYELYEVAEHAIERAIEAESLVNELRSDSKNDDALVERQVKRIEGLESLVRDLVEALEVVERFCDAVTDANGHQKLLDAIAFVRLVMPKARGVLGDG